MKNIKITFVSTFAIALILFISLGVSAQNPTEPWTQKQLLEPADLAEVLNNPEAEQPIVFCVGPQAIIKNSIDIGPTNNQGNLKKLEQQLEKLPKDANIVIYCGCCPFKNCPNVRPAFDLLNEMQFTNQKLLNLPHNVKVDWISKGYPMNDF
jgi:thiosulfate/3-mercaptopyruvate sulfurtransferase